MATTTTTRTRTTIGRQLRQNGGWNHRPWGGDGVKDFDVLQDWLRTWHPTAWFWLSVFRRVQPLIRYLVLRFSIRYEYLTFVRLQRLFDWWLRPLTGSLINQVNQLIVLTDCLRVRLGIRLITVLFTYWSLTRAMGLLNVYSASS